MPVYMPRQTGARDFAEIEADIESFGARRLFQNFNHPGESLLKIECFLERKFIESSLVRLGSDQQMSVVVREPVQNDGRERSPLHDQVLAIIAFAEGLADETL